ncbi:helix-turn-helix domain-containing protein [Aeoliella mucimassa]|uniref:Exoenzyme S synthesis regulatory protein ExsA n=1 Tax=Aeoliella mucimassa TaxID=2527972 RepID=A0A518AN10_9BACT|nr:AraC family transcriptional regulator [Aeoliella mucimassa]QDU56108.1 Exoenzyme S synthesis regulatory protein ExsA [Aeoliella mucimassa]
MGDLFTVLGISHFAIREWKELKIDHPLDVVDQATVGRLYLAREGTCQIRSHGGAHGITLGPDEMVMVAKETPHIIRPYSSEVPHSINGNGHSHAYPALVMVRFRAYAAGPDRDLTEGVQRIPLPQPGISTVRELLLEELKQTSAYSDAMCLSALQLLLVYALQQTGGYEQLPGGQLQSNGSGDPRLSPLIAEIRSDPATDWSVAKMARRACMSRSSFAARFRNVMGQAPFDYVTSVRMEWASQLLQETTLSVQQIAHRVGYESESAFSTAYKRRMGKSPTASRQCAEARW